MKTNHSVGNVTLVTGNTIGSKKDFLLLGLKRPKEKSDEKRKRKIVGSNCWVPPGGATESFDKSQKHSAQRELLQETGLSVPLKSFEKVGILKGYFDNKLRWVVHLYRVVTSGTYPLQYPRKEYVDMQWFPVFRLPFDKMIPGDKSWIPRILKGEKLSISIFAGSEVNNLKFTKIKKIKSFN